MFSLVGRRRKATVAAVALTALVAASFSSIAVASATTNQFMGMYAEVSTLKWKDGKVSVTGSCKFDKKIYVAGKGKGVLNVENEAGYFILDKSMGMNAAMKFSLTIENFSISTEAMKSASTKSIRAKMMCFAYQKEPPIGREGLADELEAASKYIDISNPISNKSTGGGEKKKSNGGSTKKGGGGKSTPTPSACADENKKIKDANGTEFSKVWTCKVFRAWWVYPEPKVSKKPNNPVKPRDVSIVCAKKGGPNPKVVNDKNTWWAYTQGDNKDVNKGWGWLPYTAIAQGGSTDSAGVPACQGTTKKPTLAAIKVAPAAHPDKDDQCTQTDKSLTYGKVKFAKVWSCDTFKDTPVYPSTKALEKTDGLPLLKKKKNVLVACAMEGDKNPKFVNGDNTWWALVQSDKVKGKSTWGWIPFTAVSQGGKKDTASVTACQGTPAKPTPTP